ncbi:MAG: transglycosylase SLT domain-containing protein [Clostridiales bacterium]|nr:transglycosylase SLT domain-containing protein [Clostridiales bacterium]
MSDSPWNVKSRRRRAPQPISPQSAQVKHVPLTPPAGEPAPTAAPQRKQRRLSKHPPQQANRPASPPKAKKAGQAIPKVCLGIVAALLVFAIITGNLLMQNQQKKDQLLAERAAEAQRILEHKQSHYRVRERSGYHDLIKKYAAEYRISASFLSAIIKCESSYDALAVSRVNARGLMQIMPDTGTWLAGRLSLKNYQPDALFDPETNIRFGAYYLAYLSDMFSGQPVMVASAYHAGANNVKHWALARAEDKKTITLDMIPMDDTRSYVRKVMDAYAIYFEQDKGGTATLPGALLFDPQRTGAGR